jgi:membrane protease YdiL (CAAX protease family)
MQSAAYAVPVPPPRDPAWGILEVLALIPISFGLIVFLSVLFMIPVIIWMIANGTLSPGEQPPIAILARAALPAQALAYLLLIAAIKMVLAKRGHPDLLKAVQWNWPSLRFTTGLALLSIAIALLANKASAHMHVPPDAPIFEMLKDKITAEMFVVFGIAVAPLAEELYFRGLLYPSLQRRTGTLAAVLLTSVFFALIHAGQVANSAGPVSILLVVGLLLTTIRARTNSLAASVIVHVTYNATLFMVGAFT